MRFRFLAMALAGLAIGLLISAAPTEAQVKKTTKKDDPAGVVEVYKNAAGAYRYRIKNADGKTIAMPLPQMSWDKKADLMKALDELKSILSDTKPVEVTDEKKDDKKSDK